MYNIILLKVTCQYTYSIIIVVSILLAMHHIAQHFIIMCVSQSVQFERWYCLQGLMCKKIIQCVICF